MKLISASRRTDIPAFYSRWFLRRLAEGFCDWINPFGGQVLHVSLRPQDTLGIVCWTRNPAPLAASLGALQQAGYGFAFHFTINGYPGELESHNPPVETALRAFRDLARRLPAGRAWWRYDPILLTEATPSAWHERNFSRLAEALEGQTRRCYFSFASFYRKTRRNLDASGLPWREPAIGEKLELARRLRLIARRHGIDMFSCCDDQLLAAGVEKARCVDASVFLPESGKGGASARVEAAPAGACATKTSPESGKGGADTRVEAAPASACATKMSTWFKLAPTRAGCGCTQSVDIGAYDTCAFGCAYCYATTSRRAALVRLGEHDPDDTALWRPKPTAGPPAAEPEAREV
ncbi:MAG: DUF1848 domain-containing protein [Acidobacteria bacterium]|nr:DUF1848 domain-containing protein [Acidobacteriota bacterium]